MFVTKQQIKNIYLIHCFIKLKLRDSIFRRPTMSAANINDVGNYGEKTAQLLMGQGKERQVVFQQTDANHIDIRIVDATSVTRQEDDSRQLDNKPLLKLSDVKHIQHLNIENIDTLGTQEIKAVYACLSTLFNSDGIEEKDKESIKIQINLLEKKLLAQKSPDSGMQQNVFLTKARTQGVNGAELLNKYELVYNSNTKGFDLQLRPKPSLFFSQKDSFPAEFQKMIKDNPKGDMQMVVLGNLCENIRSLGMPGILKFREILIDSKAKIGKVENTIKLETYSEARNQTYIKEIDPLTFLSMTMGSLFVQENLEPSRSDLWMPTLEDAKQFPNQATELLTCAMDAYAHSAQKLYQLNEEENKELGDELHEKTTTALGVVNGLLDMKHKKDFVVDVKKDVFVEGFPEVERKSTDMLVNIALKAGNTELAEKLLKRGAPIVKAYPTDKLSLAGITSIQTDEGTKIVKVIHSTERPNYDTYLLYDITALPEKRLGSCIVFGIEPTDSSNDYYKGGNMFQSVFNWRGEPKDVSGKYIVIDSIRVAEQEKNENTKKEIAKKILQIAVEVGLTEDAKSQPDALKTDGRVLQRGTAEQAEILMQIGMEVPENAKQHAINNAERYPRDQQGDYEQRLERNQRGLGVYLPPDARERIKADIAKAPILVSNRDL